MCLRYISNAVLPSCEAYQRMNKQWPIACWNARYIQISNIIAKRSQQRIQIQMPPIQIQTPPGHATNNVCSEKLCGFWVTSASKKIFHTANPPLVEGSLSSTPATQPLSHSNRVASAATQPRWVAKWLGWKFPPLRAQSHIQPSRHENQTVQPKRQRCQGSGLFAFAFSLLWLLGIPRWLLWTWGLFVLFLAFLRRQGFLAADGYYVHLLDKAQVAAAQSAGQSGENVSSGDSKMEAWLSPEGDPPEGKAQRSDPTSPWLPHGRLGASGLLSEPEATSSSLCPWQQLDLQRRPLSASLLASWGLLWQLQGKAFEILLLLGSCIKSNSVLRSLRNPLLGSSLKGYWRGMRVGSPKQET